eukprot:11599577-Prorocentrum_lima.AAC.1
MAQVFLSWTAHENTGSQRNSPRSFHRVQDVALMFSAMQKVDKHMHMGHILENLSLIHISEPTRLDVI